MYLIIGWIELVIAMWTYESYQFSLIKTFIIDQVDNTKPSLPEFDGCGVVFCATGCFARSTSRIVLYFLFSAADPDEDGGELLG
jgi:hypothetical protein